MDGMISGTPAADGNNNVFLQSLQQLGQYLQQQNAGTGSGLNLGSGGMPQQPGFNLGSGMQPSKIVTQVHYPTPESSTDQANAQPAVSTAPPAPQVSSYAPPQTPGAQPIADPNVAKPASDSGGGGGGGAGGAGGGAGGGQGPGTGHPTSNAISGITGALSKGLTDAAQTIGAVKTMPTPVQSGPFPGINQYTPSLIGRRTQPQPAY